MYRYKSIHLLKPFTKPKLKILLFIVEYDILLSYLNRYNIVIQ